MRGSLCSSANFSFACVFSVSKDNLSRLYCSSFGTSKKLMCLIIESKCAISTTNQYICLHS